MTTSNFTFDDLTAAKEALFPSRYTYNSKTVPAVTTSGTEESVAEPIVVEVEAPVAQPFDECVAQVKAYVAEVQSCAHKFTRKRDSESLEDLLNATESFSGFIIDVIGPAESAKSAD